MEERTVKTEARGITPSGDAGEAPSLDRRRLPSLSHRSTSHVDERPHLPITPVQSVAGPSYLSLAALTGGMPMSGGYTPNRFTSQPYYFRQNSRSGDSADPDDLNDTEMLPRRLREYLKLPAHIRKDARYASDASEQAIRIFDSSIVAERALVCEQVRAIIDDQGPVELAEVQKEHLHILLCASPTDAQHVFVLRSLRKLVKMSRDAANASRMYDEQGNRRPEVRPNQLA
ncbi:MAG: hypothetical protein GY696_28005, partial [Gammaproteobacteria bacterium]|nr:hypothetical protein [Gammaproteobacteria bacterium]